MLNFDVITKDPEIGKKLLIGSLLALTGVGIIALLGWMLEIMREIQRGEEPALPGFDDLGTLFVDGLKAAAIGVVWSLPPTLFVVVLASVIVGAAALFTDPDEAALLIIALNFCITGLVFAYLIPMFVLIIPAFGKLGETGSLGEALNPMAAVEIFRLNPGGFLVAAFLGLAANSVLASIGSMLCLIGIYPALVLSYALQGQFFGRAYQDASTRAV